MQLCDSSSLVPEARLKLLAEEAAAAGRGGGAGRPLDAAMLQRLAALMAEGGGDDCSICLSPFTQPCITRCGHIFCRGWVGSKGVDLFVWGRRFIPIIPAGCPQLAKRLLEGYCPSPHLDSGY